MGSARKAANEAVRAAEGALRGVRRRARRRKRRSCCGHGRPTSTRWSGSPPAPPTGRVGSRSCGSWPAPTTPDTGAVTDAAAAFRTAVARAAGHHQRGAHARRPPVRPASGPRSGCTSSPATPPARSAAMAPSTGSGRPTRSRNRPASRSQLRDVRALWRGPPCERPASLIDGVATPAGVDRASRSGPSWRGSRVRASWGRGPGGRPGRCAELAWTARVRPPCVTESVRRATSPRGRAGLADVEDRWAPIAGPAGPVGRPSPQGGRAPPPPSSL